MPTLRQASGISQRGASLSGVLLNGGAIGAVLFAGYLMDRFGPSMVAVAGFTIAIPLVVLLGHPLALHAAVYPVLFLAGIFGIGSQVGATVIVAVRYPARLQVAASSLGYLCSRAGAIAGPLTAGFLLFLDMSRAALFLVMTLPAIGSAAAFSRCREGVPSEDLPPAPRVHVIAKLTGLAPRNGSRPLFGTKRS